jgi:hypothetical protein
MAFNWTQERLDDTVKDTELFVDPDKRFASAKIFQSQWSEYKKSLSLC